MGMTTTPASAVRHRRALFVRGTVQGVGFRPAVLRLATRQGLAGFVRNDSEGVTIEIEGDDAAVLERFGETLRREAPPLVRIESMTYADVPPCGEFTFRVVASAHTGRTRASIPADAATCTACLRELFDPDNRRYRYPFINCTDCGPRFTIVRGVPYDRVATTMSGFPMCAQCRAEYDDPFDRRFHAEPNACPACGPQVTLIEGGEPVARGDRALTRVTRLLIEGAIVAVKGLGGYQLAVDAHNEPAVARLRMRKRRPHKPFAVMARDMAFASTLVEVDATARAAILSPAHPIVLLPARRDGALAPSVAPGLREIGVMLPTTPLHHLLTVDGPPVLVMTSGNLADEPIVKDDDEAIRVLAGVADAFLTHDRPIHTRADDSVVRVVAGGAQPVRRARGMVPDPIPLEVEGPCVLAVGAQQKGAVCLTRGAEAYLSQHIGDLASPEASAFFEEVVQKLQRLLGVSPIVVAHDMHPDYASTAWARASGLPCEPVQHHHAHVAACMVENGRHAQAILGVAFDGTGCGPAGDLWGGEILLADLTGFRRLAHLRPLALPGGEAAIREPWRIAVAALRDAGVTGFDFPGVPSSRRHAVEELLARDLASPRSTGAGRWFDAIASILGVRDVISYDAQAAIELEALASPFAGAPALDFTIGDGIVDLRAAVRAVADGIRSGETPGVLAARFHTTLAEAVLMCCQTARGASGAETVALSGGCFQNRLLTEQTKACLERSGFEVLVHTRVPANDGGIALGQAAIAAARQRRS